MTPELESAIREYFGRGLTDKKIIELLFEEHIDKTMYSLRYGVELSVHAHC